MSRNFDVVPEDYFSLIVHGNPYEGRHELPPSYFLNHVEGTLKPIFMSVFCPRYGGFVLLGEQQSKDLCYWRLYIVPSRSGGEEDVSVWDSAAEMFSRIDNPIERNSMIKTYARSKESPLSIKKSKRHKSIFGCDYPLELLSKMDSAQRLANGDFAGLEEFNKGRGGVGGYPNCILDGFGSGEFNGYSSDSIRRINEREALLKANKGISV